MKDVTSAVLPGAYDWDGLSQRGVKLRGIRDVKYWKALPSELRVVVISWSNSASSQGVDHCQIIFILGGKRQKKMSFWSQIRLYDYVTSADYLQIVLKNAFEQIYMIFFPSSGVPMNPEWAVVNDVLALQKCVICVYPASKMCYFVFLAFFERLIVGHHDPQVKSLQGFYGHLDGHNEPLVIAAQQKNVNWSSQWKIHSRGSVLRLVSRHYGQKHMRLNVSKLLKLSVSRKGKSFLGRGYSFKWVMVMSGWG